MVKPRPSFLKSDADEMKRHKGELNYGTESITQSDSTVREKYPDARDQHNPINGLSLSLASKSIAEDHKRPTLADKLRELWI